MLPIHKRKKEINREIKLSPSIYFPFFLSEAYVSSLLCPISLYPAVLLVTPSILAMSWLDAPSPKDYG